EREGCWAKTELPGFVAVRGCRSNGAAFVRTRQGTDQRPADRWTPLALICRGGGPSGREVDRRGGALALDACGLELPEGKTAIADQGFVGCQLLVGPLEQAGL